MNRLAQNGFVAMLLLSPSFAFATNPLALSGATDKVTDTVILSTAILDLGNELGVSAKALKEVTALRQDLKDIQNELHLSQAVINESYGVANPRIDTTEKLSYVLDSTTRYIRSIKHLRALFLSLRPRPEAVQAAEQMQTNSLLMGIMENQDRQYVREERAEVKAEQKELLQLITTKAMVDQEFKSIHANAHRTGAHKNPPVDDEGHWSLK